MTTKTPGGGAPATAPASHFPVVGPNGERVPALATTIPAPAGEGDIFPWPTEEELDITPFQDPEPPKSYMSQEDIALALQGGEIKRSLVPVVVLHPHQPHMKTLDLGLQNLRDNILLDLEKRYSKYIPHPGHPPFLKLGGLYRRNLVKTPDWAVSANGGLGGQAPGYYVQANKSNAHPSKFNPGDLVLCLTNPTMEKPFQKVLKLEDNSVQVIYSVQGMMAYWELVSEPVCPGGEEFETSGAEQPSWEEPEVMATGPEFF
jgi:hypothetical protein